MAPHAFLAVCRRHLQAALRGGAGPAWLAIGLVLLAGVLAPPSTSADRLGLRRFRTVEPSGEYLVAQRFRMDAPQLAAIEIRPAAVGPVVGSIRLTLRDRDARGVERSADVPAADLVRGGRYMFRFEPIGDSEGHEYELQIAPSPGNPVSGVAFWATRGERPEDEALRINDRPRWGSLAYRTFTPRTSSLRALTSGEPIGTMPGWLGLAALAGWWIGLRAVLRALLAMTVMADGDAAGAGTPALDEAVPVAAVTPFPVTSPPRDGLAGRRAAAR